MILGWYTAARLWFTGLPDGIRKTIYGAAAILFVAALVLWWLHQHDKKVIAAHDAKIDAQVSKKAADASEAATEAAVETKTRVEAQNDDARKAASNSDDKLGAAFERLRQGKN